jgi:plastocyanin
MTRLAPCAALACLALAATATTSAPAASPRSVTMKNIALSPAKLTITRGTTVRWLWRDGQIQHDVQWRNGGFKAAPLQAQSQKRPLRIYRITFNKPGTYRFYCSVHPGDMRGRIVVTSTS